MNRYFLTTLHHELKELSVNRYFLTTLHHELKELFINRYFLPTLHHELKELSRENYKKLSSLILIQPILVTARNKAWVCGRCIAGIAGSNPIGGMDIYLL
jgi:mannitol-1-phosphate/altronate dehydrogenase